MNNFWINKNVLITGHEGFLGSNLTRRLVGYGANVTGIDIKVRRKKTILTKDEYKKITVVKGNVSNYNLLKSTLKKYEIEYVFHLAGEAIVGECYKKPLKAFSSNIHGTWTVLEACRYHPKVKAIIVSSSDKAYGSKNNLPYTEDMPLQGDHPYDVSKSCADLLANTYYHTYNLPVVITRCGNIFGPGDFNYSRIVPDAIRNGLLNKTFLIRSDGEFIRDYIYVDDVVNGYLMLAESADEHNLEGHAFNFSNQSPLTVVQIVDAINNIIGSKSQYKILNKAEHEIKRQYLDSSKARKILKWKPKYSLTDGLKNTINWYRKYIQ